MRRAILFALILALSFCFSVPVWGAYPERSIKALVGFGAGGPGDVIARGILPVLQDKLGQGIAITNMPGAAGATAASNVLSPTATPCCSAPKPCRCGRPWGS